MGDNDAEKKPAPSRQWSQTALGVRIDISTERKLAGRPSFAGGYRGAGASGAAPVTNKTSDIHEAGQEFDMDAALGVQRRPGTAGVHPMILDPLGKYSPIDEGTEEPSQPAEQPKQAFLGKAWSKTALGVSIDISSDRKVAGHPSFAGGFAGAAAAGSEAIGPKKTELDAEGAERGLDMDAKLGIKHTPGTAGAHPLLAKGPATDTGKQPYSCD